MSDAIALLKKELPTLEALVALHAVDGTDVHAMALQEVEHLHYFAIANPIVYECTTDSVILAVKRAIRNNLTLDPAAGLMYIKTRNVKVSKYGEADKWIKVLETQETCNGLISVARQCGTLLNIRRPEVEKNANGKVIAVTTQVQLPGYDENRRPIAEWEERRFDESDFLRWRKASHKENSRGKQPAQVDNEKLNWANPNYTNFNGGIDPEFARAKCIRHGLKKLGTNPNEKMMKAISSPTIKLVIDPAAELAAIKDDLTADEQLIEQKPQSEQDKSNDDIQDAEIIQDEVPRADEL